MRTTVEDRLKTVMQQYLALVTPYGFGNIPEKVSLKATKLLEKAEKLRVKLGISNKLPPPNATPVNLESIGLMPAFAICDDSEGESR
jgi:hypothetical protein